MDRLNPMKSYLSHLECTYCSATYDADQVMNVCPDCGKPLYARYDLEAACSTFTPKVLQNGRPQNLWRYTEVLPVVNPDFRMTLGEGFTPLLRLDHLGKKLGLNNLFGKNEGANPTESFKARGLVMAVNRAAELGQKAVAVPTAGNAGIAMSAYAENCGLPAYVYVPPRCSDEVCGSHEIVWGQCHAGRRLDYGLCHFC
jgi:threonine synthase